MYLVTSPARARTAFDHTAQTVEEIAGVRSNLGKCRVYNRTGGAAPAGVAELGEEVCRGDRAPHENGLLVLGTPLGRPEFVAAHVASRMEDERRLLQELPLLPDLQAA